MEEGRGRERKKRGEVKIKKHILRDPRNMSNTAQKLEGEGRKREEEGKGKRGKKTDERGK